MMQTELCFHGPDIRPKDAVRWGKQLLAVRHLMADERWRTLQEIAAAVRAPEASVSARLRNLRAAGFTVERERTCPGSSLFRYRVKT